MSCFNPGDAIIVENGRFFARGVVIGPSDPAVTYPEPRLKVEIFRNKIDVELRLMRLAMSADRPWADAPREMLEQQLARMALELAKRPTLQEYADADYNAHLETEDLRAQIEGLGEVISMQMEAITHTPAPAKAEDTEWYERLVDHLETYLVRTVGERRPLRIDDADLRALVQHIRE